MNTHPQNALMLGIETSNPSAVAGCGVALYNPATREADTEPLRKLDRHDDDLVPAIRRLCERAGVGPTDLAGVGVSIGPGGYTGLRVACAAGKSIAECIGRPAAAIPTSLVVLASLFPDRLPIIVINNQPTTTAHHPGVVVLLAGKRGTTHATIFDFPLSPCDVQVSSNDMLQQAIDASRQGRVIGVDDAASIGLDGSGEPRTIICDDFGPPELLERVRQLGARVIGPVFDPAACARLACDPAFWVDPALLVPLYAREPDAVTQWRERHGESSGV